MSCTAAVESYAATIQEVVVDRSSTISRKGEEIDDKRSSRNGKKENNKGTFKSLWFFVYSLWKCPFTLKQQTINNKQ